MQAIVAARSNNIGQPVMENDQSYETQKKQLNETEKPASEAAEPTAKQESGETETVDDSIFDLPLEVDAAPPAEVDNSFRVWTSANGKHTTDAIIVSYANGIVTLENRAGKRTKVPLDKLSTADNDFVEGWRKERR